MKFNVKGESLSNTEKCVVFADKSNKQAAGVFLNLLQCITCEKYIILSVEKGALYDKV
jgi:hypothetical protein